MRLTDNAVEVEGVNTLPPHEIRNSADDVDLGAPIENGAAVPQIFYARHMQPGLAGYKNERINLDADSIKRMLPSLDGKPIYINHQNVVLDTMKQQASGYIANSFWNELDGWAWCKMVLIDAEAQTAARSGFKVSNAYIPSDWGGAGVCNAVPYDRAITNGRFTHLALVRDPRYEQADIFTPEQFKAYQDEKRQELAEIKNANDNQPGVNKMPFNFFKPKKEAVAAVDADTMVEITNDKGEVVETVSLATMIEEVQNAKVKKNEMADAETAAELMNENTEVTVGEEKMNMKELMNRYEAACKSKKDAEEKTNAAATAAPVAAEAPAAPVAAPTPAPAKVDHFAEISNANSKPDGKVITVDTQINRLQRGKSRYGTAE